MTRRYASDKAVNMEANSSCPHSPGRWERTPSVRLEELELDVVGIVEPEHGVTGVLGLPHSSMRDRKAHLVVFEPACRWPAYAAA
jgi:hypothetical protein